MKVREVIPHIASLPIVIPYKLFQDYINSSAENVTLRAAWKFLGGEKVQHCCSRLWFRYPRSSFCDLRVPAMLTSSNHVRPQNVYAHFPPNCPPFFYGKSRTTRRIEWEFAQLSTVVKMGSYDWLSVNPRGNTRSRWRSKTNLRGIIMGSEAIWGITSLTCKISCQYVYWRNITTWQDCS